MSFPKLSLTFESEGIDPSPKFSYQIDTIGEIRKDLVDGNIYQAATSVLGTWMPTADKPADREGRSFISEYNDPLKHAIILLEVGHHFTKLDSCEPDNAAVREIALICLTIAARKFGSLDESQAPLKQRGIREAAALLKYVNETQAHNIEKLYLPESSKDSETDSTG